MRPGVVSAEVASFAAVGIAATAVHVGTGLGAAGLLGLAPLTANAIAFCASVLVSYLGNSLLTFKVSAARTGAFIRFLVLAGAGFILNQAIVWTATELLGLAYWVGLAIVVATVPAASFVLSKYWALAEA